MADRCSRRAFLASAAAVGSPILAGCAEESSLRAETATHSRPEAPTPTPNLVVTVVDVGGHTVQVNQPLTVTISVSNEGGASGTFETAASFGELAADAKSVVIEPDATETLTFTFQPESFGRQAIEIEAIPDMQAAVSVVPVPRGPDELDAVRSVGAHYYPWYGAPAHDWRDGNWSLESPSTSVLGDYTSSRDYVIDWCHTAGIDWLSVAW